MPISKTIAAAFIALSFVSVTLHAQMPGARIGSFDTFADIGAPAMPGAASYHAPSQTYHITGTGSNIWFATDSFSFLSKTMQGDFILQTQVSFVGEGHVAHRKAAGEEGK